MALCLHCILLKNFTELYTLCMYMYSIPLGIIYDIVVHNNIEGIICVKSDKEINLLLYLVPSHVHNHAVGY